MSTKKTKHVKRGPISGIERLPKSGVKESRGRGFVPKALDGGPLHPEGAVVNEDANKPKKALDGGAL